MPKPATAPRVRTLVSIEQAAEMLGVCTKSVRRYVAAGELPALRIAGSRLIRLDVLDVEALLSPIPTTAPRKSSGGVLDAA